MHERGAGDQHLRASWHPGRRSVVFSHWRDNVCVATTPVPVEELPAVIGLLARALSEVAVADQTRGAGPPWPGSQPMPDPAPLSWLRLGANAAGLAQRSLEVGFRVLGRLARWS